MMESIIVSMIARYEHFGWFGDDEVFVALKPRFDKLEIMIDRFRETAELSRVDDELAFARVRICQVALGG